MSGVIWLLGRLFTILGTVCESAAEFLEQFALDPDVDTILWILILWLLVTKRWGALLLGLLSLVLVPIPKGK